METLKTILAIIGAMLIIGYCMVFGVMIGVFYFNRWKSKRKEKNG